MPERGIETSRDQRIEPARNEKIISEREIGGVEKGIEIGESQERGVEAGAARERGIDSNVREKKDEGVSGAERCIEVPGSLGENAPSTGLVLLQRFILMSNFVFGFASLRPRFTLIYHEGVKEECGCKSVLP